MLSYDYSKRPRALDICKELKNKKILTNIDQNTINSCKNIINQQTKKSIKENPSDKYKGILKEFEEFTKTL